MAFGGRELRRGGDSYALHIGCGAGRNAVPLARLGWQVTGIDLSGPMLSAAARRVRDDQLGDRVRLALAPMGVLPIGDSSYDLVIAHGIWNLARSVADFRRAVREAARVSKIGAGLFAFVFTQFSGVPQCFLTEEQLVSELGAAGFLREPSVPLNEYNRPRPGTFCSGAPVIYEAAFRRDG